MMRNFVGGTNSGAAHIGALILLLILAVSVGHFVASVRHTLHVSKLMDHRAETRRLLVSGKALAENYLLQHPGVSNGCNSIYLVIADDLMSTTTLVQPMDTTYLKCLMWCQIASESGKININKAESEVLGKLFNMPKFPLAALLDWIDLDTIAQSGGSEAYYFQSLAPNQFAKNRPLESLEELTWLPGVEDDHLNGISAYATVYGNGQIDINACREEVLRAFDFSDTFSRRFVNVRQGPDGMPGTADDIRFTLDSLIVRLSAHMPVDAADRSRLHDLLGRGQLTAQTECWRIIIHAGSRSPQPTAIAEMVACFNECGTLTTSYWREN